jgi:hypothetical protein
MELLTRVSIVISGFLSRLRFSPLQPIDIDFVVTWLTIHVIPLGDSIHHYSAVIAMEELLYIFDLNGSHSPTW